MFRCSIFLFISTK